MIGERPAERCWLQRPAALKEQRFAQPLLQHRQCARNGRLRQADKSGTLGDTAGLYDRRQLDQMPFIELHTNMVY